MKNQFQSYRADADGTYARRSRAEQSGVVGPGAPGDRPRDERRDGARDGSRDTARDARNARGEHIAADAGDAPRDASRDKVRDGSRDGTRHAARGSAGDNTQDSGRDDSGDITRNGLNDGARDTRIARGEQIGADTPDAPRNGPRNTVRDGSRDSTRDAAHDSARDGARDARIAAERRLLAALCQGSIAADARDVVMQRLREHVFGDPEHELIFRALAKIPGGDAEFVREALGLRLTRAGFPDFDLEPFFDAAPPDAGEIAKILREFDSL